MEKVVLISSTPSAQARVTKHCRKSNPNVVVFIRYGLPEMKSLTVAWASNLSLRCASRRCSLSNKAPCRWDSARNLWLLLVTMMRRAAQSYQEIAAAVVASWWRAMRSATLLHQQQHQRTMLSFKLLCNRINRALLLGSINPPLHSKLASMGDW
jgi:hypothetical protein